MNPIQKLYLRLRYGWNSILANPEHAHFYQQNTAAYFTRRTINVTPSVPSALALPASVPSVVKIDPE